MHRRIARGAASDLDVALGNRSDPSCLRLKKMLTNAKKGFSRHDYKLRVTQHASRCFLEMFFGDEMIVECSVDIEGTDSI